MHQSVRFLIILLLLSSLTFGRGGGGCVLPNTLILTPAGEKPVATLSSGDEVFCFSNGRIVNAKVVGVYETEAQEYFEIKTKRTALNVTAEHPFLVGGGQFKEAEQLKAGDVIFVFSEGGLVEDRVDSIIVHKENAKVYNLLVEKGSFFANSILLHNKGCFLPDTPILTADGALVNVSAVRKGDRLVAFTYQGTVVNTTVEDVYTATAESYYVIKTQNYEVRVTGEHPFYVGDGVFKTAESLQVGDVVYVFNGSELSKERIAFKELVEEKITVYNIRTDWPNTYFANFIAVHNKGGCFLPGTQIETPLGRRRIEELKEGEMVIAFDSAGRISSARVMGIVETRERGFYRIRTGGYEVNVTPEHPFLSERGLFIKAVDLREGDVVYVLENGKLKAERIVEKRFFDEPVSVFNLNVDGLHTFFANNFAVHNKGGCFAAGTRILTPAGETSIERLREGDVVLAVDEKGRMSRAKVVEVFRTKSAILQIKTSARAVNTTAEHPFLVKGEFREASQLSPGDTLRVFDGGIHDEVVVSLEYLGEGVVYNLHVDEPFTFVANGFVVHNKGGSFRGGSSRSSYNPNTDATYCGKTKNLTLKNGGVLTGSECFYVYYAKANSAEAARLESCAKQTDSVWSSCGGFTAFAIRSERQFRCATPEPCMGIGNVVLSDGSIVKVTRPKILWESIIDLLIIVILLGVFALAVFGFVIFGGVLGIIGLASRASLSEENLDYCYPSYQIDRKAERTAKLLNYLKGIDKQWEPELLKNTARDTFLKLQECWEKREYSPMQPLLMPNLYAQHLEQIDSMIRNHEINKLESLQIRRIDIVHLRHYVKKEQQEFTALIEASVRDYYVDDRTGEFLRGDSEPATFQEFWVFQRKGDRWLLREIDQTRESDALREENFVEELTPMQLENIYGEPVGAVKGEKAPWLEDRVGWKADRVHRLLNFLSSVDKSWDEDYMKESARKIFVAVLSGFEELSIEEAKPLLMPDTVSYYEQQIEEMKKEGRGVEYRNLCVRKVDIVLVKNFADSNKDEFTARISAHAQRIEKKDGRVMKRDEYVTPFEEYWTFQKQNGEWKLREVEPPARTRSIIEEENIDEESSKEQLQWYYTQERAV